MRNSRSYVASQNLVALVLLSAVTALARVTTTNAEIPGPVPENAWAEWPSPWGPGVPGAFSAADLIERPAGKHGPVVVRDGHFFTGDGRRIRFWGVNIAFSGCFPTHQQADATAQRLAAFGINAVRLHHMDSHQFPNGIWADAACEHLSPEALERLDYFVAALKKQGVYSNINLHVSRAWSKTHHWPDADQHPETYDKVLDIFHPELIAANKQYARDLLTHVNQYTGNRYAAEPAVCIVEINNEDTIFLWGGEAALNRLPEQHLELLGKLWNQWLAGKYGTRERLKAAWAAGAQPMGENLLKDTTFATLKPKGGGSQTWLIEQHEGARMTVDVVPGREAQQPAVRLRIEHVTPTSWHLQFNQPGLTLKNGQLYTVRFLAKADKARSIDVAVAQAHPGYGNLGLTTAFKVSDQWRSFRFGFTATADDTNGRISFSVGQEPGEVQVASVELRPGGTEGLRDDEDPALGTVRRNVQDVVAGPARSDDWYAFLQYTDEHYWVDMRQFLRNELGVKAPITGTFVLGPLGQLGQSKMDFVDAHSYWDHPHFPHKPWDMKDWLMGNKPMVDNPAGATLWGLAATRVAGKPQTITEYNHAAPNEWAAECVPMIAAYAALQDWDGVFLFAYTHASDHQKTKISSFFDIEGNPTKMPLVPLGARIFLGRDVNGALAPLAGTCRVAPAAQELPPTGMRYYSACWSWLKSRGVDWTDALQRRLAVDLGFEHPAAAPAKDGPAVDPSRLAWSASGPGTGRFTVNDPQAAIFAGFAGGGPLPLDLSSVRLEQLQTPFAVLMLVPADPAKTLQSADRLLLAAVARAENTGMQWEPNRRSVSNHWGQAPARIEVVNATLSLPATKAIKVYALKPDGSRGAALPVSIDNGRAIVKLGSEKTLWYELER